MGCLPRLRPVDILPYQSRTGCIHRKYDIPYLSEAPQEEGLSAEPQAAGLSAEPQAVPDDDHSLRFESDIGTPPSILGYN